MLIFGYGSRAPKDRGAAAPLVCPNCHNLTWFHLVTVRKAVSLFFVPVIPLRADDALVCATCRYAFPLGRPDAAAAIDMVRDSTRHRSGALTDLEYGMLVDQFWQRVAQRSGPDRTPEGATWAAPAPPASAEAAPAAPPSGPPMRRAEPPPVPPDPFAPAAPEAAGALAALTSGVGAAEQPPPPDPATRSTDPPPGWYPDPYGRSTERYWDGERWTQAAR